MGQSNSIKYTVSFYLLVGYTVKIVIIIKRKRERCVSVYAQYVIGTTKKKKKKSLQVLHIQSDDHPGKSEPTK